MAIMNDFHKNGGDIGFVNSTFIMLIPKKGGVVDITDFQPISLLNGVYKIVAKCLAERLQPLMHKHIADFQSTFVEGRILVGFLVAHECIEARVRQKIPRL